MSKMQGKLFCKRLIQSLVIGCFLIVFGLFLMIGAYTLPTEQMKEHVKEDIFLLEKEGAYPVPYGDRLLRLNPGNLRDIKALILNTRGLARDNFTDSIMLGTAVYDNGKDESIVRKAMSNERNDMGQTVPIVGLSDFVNGRNEGHPQGYERYWHGYLIVLKPLLLIMTYSQIKAMNVILQSLLIAVILYVMLAIKRDRQGALLFLYSLMFTFPFIIPFCMQYSTMFYIMLVSVLFMLLKHPYLMEKHRFCLFYFVVGMLTSYFDFLTYPLISLGIPLVLQMNLECVDRIRKKWMQIVESALLWGFGYVLMWSSKWVLASVILGKNIISDAITQVLYRSSSEAEMGGADITALKAVFSNCSSYTNILFLACIFVGLTAVIYLIKKNKKVCEDKDIYWIYVPLVIMPFIWYAVFKNHSYTHGSFTYRSLMITVYAGMSMLMRNINIEKWGPLNTKQD